MAHNTTNAHQAERSKKRKQRRNKSRLARKKRVHDDNHSEARGAVTDPPNKKRCTNDNNKRVRRCNRSNDSEDNGLVQTLLEGLLFLLLCLLFTQQLEDDEYPKKRSRGRNPRIKNNMRKPWGEYVAEIMQPHHDGNDFYKNFGVPPVLFRKISRRIRRRITPRRNTRGLMSLTPDEKLGLFLRHCRSALSYRESGLVYDVGEAVAGKTIHEVARAIAIEFKGEIYLPTPDELKKMDEDFAKHYHMHGYAGAMDGTVI